MSKKDIRARTQAELLKRSRNKTIVISVVAVLAVLAAAFFLLHPKISAGLSKSEPTAGLSPRAAQFLDRSERLRSEVIGADGKAESGAQSIPGVGYVTFLSVSDGENRASVFTGVGDTPAAAWDKAEADCANYVEVTAYNAKWLRADLICDARLVTPEELSALIAADRDNYFRYGVSLDSGYTQALLEAELNGCGIYDYAESRLDLAALNERLESRGDRTANSLPEQLRIFRSLGWFMDEDGEIYVLTAEGESGSGRRVVERVDAELVRYLAENTSGYILNHISEGGSFRYGVYPCTGEEIEGYSSLLHAAAVWGLELTYRATGDESLLPAIESTVEQLLAYVRLSDDVTAYLYEPAWDELKTGGAGIAIVALTEYMDITGSELYLDVAQALGNGLISMQDQWTGQFWHICDGFLRKTQQVAEPYYDGAAVYGLARLYGADGDPKWLSAARLGMDYMIANDYAVYADQWASYAVNELTKYLNDERYFAFGLENAQRNLADIKSEEAAAPEHLELLMAAFELYERAKDKNIPQLRDFELDTMLEVIYQRANRLLDGYFFPECAMFMKTPSRILDAFMVWDGVCRVRIDDIQHNVCAYYLYSKELDALIAAGMTPAE